MDYAVRAGILLACLDYFVYSDHVALDNARKMVTCAGLASTGAITDERFACLVGSFFETYPARRTYERRLGIGPAVVGVRVHGSNTEVCHRMLVPKVLFPFVESVGIVLIVR